MVAGLLVAAVLGLFAINYFVDQVIVGVVLNVLVIGLTSFMFSQVLAPNAATLNSPPRFRAVADPGPGRHPADRPDLLPADRRSSTCSTSPSPLVTWALYRTKWGLRVRAVGEHPKAADTVGIKVNRTRFRTILLAGAIAGMGGAFYTLVSVPQFNREMTGGAGYIALAAVIFGKWDPIRATLAALLFGFASNLQGVLSVIGSPVPSQFMLMLPYVVTIFAVAGLVGRSRPPAADGIPYRTTATSAARSDSSARRAGKSQRSADESGQATVRASTATRGQHPGGDQRGALVDAQVALVEVERRAARGPGAEPTHRAGDARRGTRRSPRRPGSGSCSTRPSGPSTRSTAPAEQLGGGRVVDHRRDAAAVVDLGLDAVRRHDVARCSSRTSRSACDQATASSIRTVPPTTPAAGITLGATPARTMPHTTLTPARGSRRRDSTAGSSVISLARAKVRSSVRCGREVWPPLPVSRTSSWSAAPVIGPSRSPTWPTSRVGSQCRQKICSTPSRAPSVDQAQVAPPGMTSSAGWNSSRTRPGSSPAAVHLGQGEAGADQRRRCARRARRRARRPGGC